jgi:hypothetical protein
MSLAYYHNGAQRAPTTPRPPQPKQHRRAVDWNRIRREIEVERRMLILTDRYSVRLRPSVAPVGWGL